MADTRWTKDVLDKASEEGDDESARPNADTLATAVMVSGEGIRRHNELLQLVDMLLASPALALSDKSELRRRLREFSPDALEYFEPAPAPDWVDESKLARACAIWRDNSLAMTGVLYALSLPTAYLYEKGVPGLYATAKLAEHKYIFQRIYETGLFVDAVMDEDGLEVLRDCAPGAGREERPKRFLWGRGFLSARKVRFLHASIRFMLLHPERFPAGVAEEEGSRTFREQLATLREAWDLDKYGKPINQEELSLVLLTFGYLIPRGLERWGCRLTRDEKEAFLHLWKVVGHVMGIREDLMTDDWDEAKVLLETILERQARESEFGRHLTTSLMGFMRSYLPHLPAGLRQRLPAHLIIDQLRQLSPAYPEMILTPEDYRASRKLLPRTAYGALTLWLRLYYRVRNRLMGAVPLVGETLLSALHRSSEELIESWRDQFRRRPFEVSGRYAWEPERGADETALQRWRNRVFNNLGFAVLLLFVAVGLLLAGGVVALLSVTAVGANWPLVRGLGLGAVLSGVLSWLWMTWRLPAVFARRPEPGGRERAAA